MLGVVSTFMVVLCVTLSAKMLALKAKLWTWNWSSFGDVNSFMNNSLSNLDLVQEEISYLSLSNDHFARESLAQSAVHEALRLQEIFLKDRSRVRWLSLAG